MGNTVNKPKVLCKGGAALSISDCDADTCCEAIPVASCATFKGCKGKIVDEVTKKEGDEILRPKDPAPSCVGDETTCNIDTCCDLVPDEDSCFPGEAEVSVQDRSSVRVDKLESGTEVLTGGGFEPVVGLLHLHSEVSPTVAQATAVSV